MEIDHPVVSPVEWRLFLGQTEAIRNGMKLYLQSCTITGAGPTPGRTRQLLFISLFITDIRHINGKDNIVTDTLSRIETILFPTDQGV